VQSANARDQITRAILIEVNLGSILSVTGSLGTILWLAALRRGGPAISAVNFLKLGLVVMLPFDLREAVGHEPVQERRADCGGDGREAGAGAEDHALVVRRHAIMQSTRFVSASVRPLGISVRARSGGSSSVAMMWLASGISRRLSCGVDLPVLPLVAMTTSPASISPRGPWRPSAATPRPVAGAAARHAGLTFRCHVFVQRPCLAALGHIHFPDLMNSRIRFENCVSAVLIA
jgi:hypothetical protein